MTQGMEHQPRRALRETLRVVAVRDGQVELEMTRSAGCAACAVRHGCGSRALTEMATARRTAAAERLTLPHHGPVRPGDRAVVVMASGAFLGAVGLIYLLPVLALVLWASLSAALGLADIPAAVLCLPVLACSFVPLWLAGRRGRHADTLSIERIVPAASAP